MSQQTETDCNVELAVSRSNLRRPVIGITAGSEVANYSDWTKQVALVPFKYVTAIQRAGGRAVLLTPDEDSIHNPEHVLSLVDGLVISGGVGDIDPAHYGEDQHPATNPVGGLRDSFELSLVKATERLDMPTLGVCRGMQIINVAHGGTLEQHLPDAVGHQDHRPKPGSYNEHEVKLECGSLAEKGVGAEQASVMSSHHQGVAELGDDLEATGWSMLDEMVEAIEHPERSFMLGVQWHPEEDESSEVIASLVERTVDHLSRTVSVVRRQSVVAREQ